MAHISATQFKRVERVIVGRFNGLNLKRFGGALAFGRNILDIADKYFSQSFRRKRVGRLNPHFVGARQKNIKSWHNALVL